MLKRYASAVITLGLTLAVAVISTGNGRAQSHPMLTPGSFTRLPSEMRHYAIANGETILQIYGQGPFEIKYVNPKDDPSKKQ